MGLEFHYQLPRLDSHTSSLSRKQNALWDSAYDSIARAGIQQRTEIKTNKELYLQDIIGNTSTGRQGIEMSHFQQNSKVSAAMVMAEVQRTEDQCIS